jgi:hypothetical protein
MRAMSDNGSPHFPQRSLRMSGFSVTRPPPSSSCGPEYRNHTILPDPVLQDIGGPMLRMAGMLAPHIADDLLTGDEALSLAAELRECGFDELEGQFVSNILTDALPVGTPLPPEQRWGYWMDSDARAVLEALLAE